MEPSQWWSQDGNPGIANWVDTSGLEEGIIMLRWQVLPRDASPPTLRECMRSSGGERTCREVLPKRNS